jgi:ribosomal protein L32
VKGGVTKRIEEITKALDGKQLKKALYLSEAKGLERHHEWVEKAARTCLANRQDKATCEQAIKEAREKVQATVSLPLDDTGLEGLEEYMTGQKLPETGTVKAPAAPGGFLAKAHKTDEELFEECEECHVALAAARFADVCAENPEEAGGCEVIGRSLENENTEPADWIKAMVQTAEKAQGTAKEEMVGAITELTDYLEQRNSPLLKTLDKEEEMAKCPNCGGPLDKHGCCSKCGTCTLKQGGKSNA